MSHAENSYEVIIDPILGERTYVLTKGLHCIGWVCVLIVPENAQPGHQRIVHDRSNQTTLHTSPIHGTTFLNPAEDLQPGINASSMRVSKLSYY